MTFKRLSEYFQQLEETTLRNKMVEILASLFKEAHPSEIGKLCYLLQGRVAPLYEAIEFGMADKMVVRAIADGLKIETSKVAKIFQKEGDLGVTVEKLKSSRLSGIHDAVITHSSQTASGQKSLPAQAGNLKSTTKKLNINDVFEVLYRVATSGGEGSQEQKVKLLGSLIHDLDPLSTRYVVRIPINKLRLGFSDMTILDSLSWMLKGSKELRSKIEKAYNVRPDLGFISQTVKEKGIEGLIHTTPKVGTPILMARAERMTSGKDIIEKIGKCAVEPKYDGFRLQGHFKKGDNSPKPPLTLRGGKGKFFIKLFSRNLEDVTSMYPDIVEGIVRQMKVKEAILEGEAVAYNPNTGEYLPFQETVQRKRKYNIEAKAKEIPLKLFAFDLLLVNGKSMLEEGYSKRRKELEKLVSKGEVILLANEEEVDQEKRLEEIFQDAVSRGLEGVMAKKLNGIYRAGSRDFNWIKYKRSYTGKLADTIDAVVMGYDFGQGKRTAFGIGDFLIGVYDKRGEKFVTVAKIGTGLTDEEWKELKVKSQPIRQAQGRESKVKSTPANYEVDKIMDCDVWVKPEIVVEIRADEITRSPVHTAGRVMKLSKSGNAYEVKEAGYALRFPRLERFRKDKNPEDATTVEEMIRIYKLQGKK